MSLIRPDKPFARSPKFGGATFTSRDYDLPIVPCVVTVCPANKARFCTMASLIDIGADGRCKTGVRFLDAPSQITKSPFPYQKPPPPDGD